MIGGWFNKEILFEFEKIKVKVFIRLILCLSQLFQGFNGSQISFFSIYLTYFIFHYLDLLDLYLLIWAFFLSFYTLFCKAFVRYQKSNMKNKEKKKLFNFYCQKNYLKGPKAKKKGKLSWLVAVYICSSISTW